MKLGDEKKDAPSPDTAMIVQSQKDTMTSTVDESVSQLPSPRSAALQFPHLRRRQLSEHLEAILPPLEGPYVFEDLIHDDMLYYHFEKALKVLS